MQTWPRCRLSIPAYGILLLACLLTADRETAQANNAVGQPHEDLTHGTRALMEDVQRAIPKTLDPTPLYAGEIPNSKSTPDGEQRRTPLPGLESISDVSHPTYTTYLPPAYNASGAAIIIFPGGGYTSLTYSMEGSAVAEILQNQGMAAVVVKYRLPSDVTMVDKSVGPLQDAQQAVLVVRQHAREWGIDPHKIGVMGFSAGGHLASTVATHFAKSYVANPDGIDLRPDFQILVYPVISMKSELTHPGSRNALLGQKPLPALVEQYSNELQVTSRTPPALLLGAGDDTLVDIENSIRFYDALQQNHVPATLHVFARGQHGFFLIPKNTWFAEISSWLISNSLMKP